MISINERIKVLDDQRPDCGYRVKRIGVHQGPGRTTVEVWARYDIDDQVYHPKKSKRQWAVPLKTNF